MRLLIDGCRMANPRSDDDEHWNDAIAEVDLAVAAWFDSHSAPPQPGEPQSDRAAEVEEWRGIQGYRSRTPARREVERTVLARTRAGAQAAIDAIVDGTTKETT